MSNKVSTMNSNSPAKQKNDRRNKKNIISSTKEQATKLAVFLICFIVMAVYFLSKQSQLDPHYVFLIGFSLIFVVIVITWYIKKD